MTSLEPKTSLRAVVLFGLAAVSPAPSSSEPNSLMQAVLAAVGPVEPNGLCPVAGREAGLAFQPKTLLALLSYCYARQIYASAEIEGLMRRDVHFRQLCGQEFPAARHFRRFRRDNRTVLHGCLVAALRFLARQLARERIQKDVSEPDLAEEASHRLSKAMFIDSMELDDG